MKQILITMITAAMYLGLPILWTMMMGWVGYRMMSEVNHLAGQMTGTTQQAGSSGGGVAGRGASAMTRGGKK